MGLGLHMALECHLLPQILQLSPYMVPALLVYCISQCFPLSLLPPKVLGSLRDTAHREVLSVAMCWNPGEAFLGVFFCATVSGSCSAMSERLTPVNKVDLHLLHLYSNSANASSKCSHLGLCLSPVLSDAT